MKRFIACCVWACLYVICVCLGMTAMPQDFGAVLRVIMALGFFVPGVLLLYWAHREGDRKTLRQLRILSIAVLALTLLALIANLASFAMSELWGRALYVILVLVSVPMTCLGHWAWGLFLWACLLMATFLRFPDTKQ